MVQIMSSANSVYDIPWPRSFSSFLDLLKVFMVDLITITKVSVTIIGHMLLAHPSR